VDVAQTRGGVVEVAKTAFVRADLGVHDLRILETDTVEGPVLGAEVHLGVGPAHLVELAVLLARLLHLQRAVADVQRRGDDLQAFRTQGSGPAGKALLKLRWHRHDCAVLPRLAVHVSNGANRIVSSTKGHCFSPSYPGGVRQKIITLL